MNYRFDADVGLERIACDQLDRALRGLEHSEHDRREAVHEARKCGKRLRGLLRLARAGLGDEVYHRENAAVRDATRRLAGLRDAVALIETYDRLHARFASEVDLRGIGQARRALVLRHKRLAADRTLPGQIETCGQELRQVRARLPSWPLADVGFDSLAPGLKRTYRRGRDAMHLAYDAPRDEHFHEWRKRAKYHRYHLELLRDLWPSPLKARRAEVKALGDLLGEEHDLSVLRATVQAEGDAFGDRTAERLLELAGRRQAELRAEMRPLGLRLFAERPKALVRRYEQYWQAWRSENGGLDKAA